MKQLEKLSQRHKDIAQYMVNHPKATQEEVRKKYDLSHPTICKICNSKVFQDYVDELLKIKWKDAGREAQDMMILLMEMGDRQATQYILDSLGYKPKEQVEVSTSDTIRININ